MDRLNIKITSHQYRDSQNTAKTVSRASHFYNGNPYTWKDAGKMAFILRRGPGKTTDIMSKAWWVLRLGNETMPLLCYKVGLYNTSELLTFIRLTPKLQIHIYGMWSGLQCAINLPIKRGIYPPPCDKWNYSHLLWPPIFRPRFDDMYWYT